MICVTRSLPLVFTLWIFLVPTSTADETPAGRRFAVVVGIDKYRASGGLGDLAYAEDDATRIAEVLKARGFTVIELTHSAAREPGSEHLAPNCEYIRDVIRSILETPNLGKDDTVLISLHGHGVHFDAREPDGNRTAEYFFCPADATINGIENAEDAGPSNFLISIDELYEKLRGCQASTRLLIVDACRNDPSRTVQFRSATLASRTLPKLPDPPGGILAFFSCKADQTAIEDKSLGHGVFSHFLFLGLSGKADLALEGEPADGIITMSELASYVSNNTHSHVLKKFGGRFSQSPEIRGVFDAQLPIGSALLTTSERSPTPAPSARVSKADRTSRREPKTESRHWNGLPRYGTWRGMVSGLELEFRWKSESTGELSFVQSGTKTTLAVRVTDNHVSMKFDCYKVISGNRPGIVGTALYEGKSEKSRFIGRWHRTDGNAASGSFYFDEFID